MLKAFQHRELFDSALGLLAPNWHLWSTPEKSLSQARAMLAAALL